MCKHVLCPAFRNVKLLTLSAFGVARGASKMRMMVTKSKLLLLLSWKVLFIVSNTNHPWTFGIVLKKPIADT